MNTIQKLCGITLFISLSIFSVFSQENNSEEKAKQERTLEQSKKEKLLLQEQKRRENIRYRESVRELERALNEEKLGREKTKKYAASFHLLALMFEGGLKFEFSKSLTYKQWLQVTPAVYFFPSLANSYPEDDYYYNYNPAIKTVGGAGIDIGYKFYYPHPRRFFSINAGVGYSYFNVGYLECQHCDYFPFNEYELDYYGGAQEVNDNQHFNNLKAFTSISVQTPMRVGFFIGANLGLGYQYSFYDDKKAALGKDVFDYGYRGLYPVIEFKMGYAW